MPALIKPFNHTVSSQVYFFKLNIALLSFESEDILVDKTLLQPSVSYYVFFQGPFPLFCAATRVETMNENTLLQIYILSTQEVPLLLKMTSFTALTNRLDRFY